jgi:hypothetical protein
LFYHISWMIANITHLISSLKYVNLDSDHKYNAQQENDNTYQKT